MDLETFVSTWNLDASAQTALMQLEPEVQAKVVQDFAPKPGTRDVNKLFHGFIRSVLTSQSALQRSAEVANAEALAAHQAALLAVHSSAAQVPPGYEPAAYMSDVQAFLAQWGLDASAHAMLLEQPPEVQARVIIEFQPKPGTRDVNRLFHGFLKSVRNTGLPQQPAAGVPTQAQAFWGEDAPISLSMHEAVSQCSAAAYAAAAHAAGIAGVHSGQDGSGAADNRGRRVSRWSTSPPPSSAGGPDVAALQAFIMQWGLDEAAQRALLQLDPVVQSKVIADFAPKPGTRDVNRLFHGFLRSVQTGGAHGGRTNGGVAVDSASALLSAYGTDFPAHVAMDAGTAAMADHTSALLSAIYQTELAIDTARLTNFIQTWGLDESSQVMLLQLDPQVQQQVMQDFAPKPHTQDVNRLFHGFVRSVGSRATGPIQAQLGASSMMAMQQAASIGAAITESLAAQGGYISAAAGKRAGETYGNEAPSADEVAGFLQSWGLDSTCASALECQPPEVQRRVLEQFRPRPGTRDVRSLFYGFIKSVATGGGKRPRPESQASQWPDVSAEGLLSA